MALTKFGFIVTGRGLDPAKHRMVMQSDRFEMIAVGIDNPTAVPAVARALVDEGIELLELCGGFGPVWTARVIEAIGGKIAVGSVGYGPEAIAPMHRLFGDGSPEGRNGRRSVAACGSLSRRAAPVSPARCRSGACRFRGRQNG